MLLMSLKVLITRIESAFRYTGRNLIDQFIGFIFLLNQIEGIIKVSCYGYGLISQCIMVNRNYLEKLGIFGGAVHPALFINLIHFRSADRNNIHCSARLVVNIYAAAQISAPGIGMVMTLQGNIHAVFIKNRFPCCTLFFVVPAPAR